MSSFQNIQGLEQLNANLKRLPALMVTKVLRRGVAAAAGVIKGAAAQYAPIGSRVKKRKGLSIQPGTLRRSAIVKYLPAESNGTQVEYIVTFRQGNRAARAGKDAYYASWVEFGHRVVPRGKRIKDVYGLLRNQRTIRARRALSTTRVPPHRYFGPAFDATSGKALTVMIATIEANIDKALA